MRAKNAETNRFCKKKTRQTTTIVLTEGKETKIAKKVSNDYKNIFALWQGYSEEVEAPERGLWLGLIFNKIKKKATSLLACKSTSGSHILRAKN